MMLMECDECGLRAEVYVDGSCIECAEKRLAKQAKQIKAKDEALKLALPVFRELDKIHKADFIWQLKITGSWTSGVKLIERALKGTD